MKRCVLYARVSTADQKDNGYSLPSQIEACKRYALAHDFEVVDICQDDISGTTPIADRFEGAKVQTLIEARAVDAVIVHQVDRLFRDTVELLITARQWLRRGVELHFCDIGKVHNENDILLVIRGWAGSDERLKIRERLKRGKDSKAKSGKIISAWVTPFGYDYNDGELSPNQDAETVKLIFRWYTTGDGDKKPLPIRAICKRLEAMGIKTPGAGRYQRKSPETAWNPATVGKILGSETYIGIWRWGITRVNEGTRDNNPGEEQVEVPVPAIIDHETWKIAQERKTRNKQLAKRNRKYDYLLSGYVTCGECGRAMAGGQKKGMLYYVCTNYMQASRDEHGNRRCTMRAVRESVLAPIVWDYVLSVVTNRDYFEEKLRQAQQQELDELLPKRERLVHIQALLIQCDKDAAELGQALRAAGERGRVSELLKIQIDSVNTRYMALDEERQILEAEIASGALSDAAIVALLDRYHTDIFIGIENATFDDKRNMFDNLKLKATVYSNKTVKVSCRLPVPEYVYSVNSTLLEFCKVDNA